MRVIFIFIISFSFGTFGISQPEDWNIKIYNTGEGLSHREIRDMARDSRNFLWVATAAGLDRFDGYTFLNFSNSVNESPFKYKGKKIKNVYQFEKDYLLLVFTGRLDSLEIMNTLTFESQIVSLSDDGFQVSNIFVSEQQEVFVLYSGSNLLKIKQLSPDGSLLEKERFDIAEEQILSEEPVSQLLKDSSGLFKIINVATGFLYKKSNSGNFIKESFDEIFEQKIPKENNHVLLFFESPDSSTYVSFEKPIGIFKREKGQTTFRKMPQTIDQFAFNKLKKDDSGNYFIGAEKDFYVHSLYKLSKNGQLTESSFILEEQKKINNFFGKNFDEDFFLSSHVGLYHFVKKEKKGLNLYLNDPNLTSDFGKIMRGITSHKNGKIYIAEEQQNWYELNPKTRKITTLIPLNNSGIRFDTINGGASLITDHEGAVWGVSYDLNRKGRIHKYNPDTKTWKVWEAKTAGRRYRLFFQGRDKKYWALGNDFGTKKGFIFLFDPKTGKTSPLKKNGKEFNPLEAYDPQFITQLSDGNFAIGTISGLLIFDPITYDFESIEKFKLKENYIPVITEAPDKKLWIGTLRDGLFIMDREKTKYKNLTVEDGLPGNEIYGIQYIKNNIWLISTGSGLCEYNSEKETFRNFYRDDGLPNDEFNRLSFFMDDSENIYFGGINGLSFFEGRKFFETDSISQIQISRFFKYSNDKGEEIEEFNMLEFENIKITPDIQYFGFEFMMPQYWEAEKNLFRTWLEGFEDKPRALTTQNQIRYDQLPPGNYTLHIGTADWDGTKNKSLYSTNITVEQVFYKTLWFALTSIGFTLLFIYVLYKHQINKLKKKQEEKSLIKSKMAMLELQALRAQLNPHFIFNCMGTIEYFIQQKDSKTAGKYLTKFGRLMRMFLESSRTRYISLEEELEMLHLYIDLERMRFSQPFQYNLSVAKTIDQADTFIPSILLQPFVENAIKHGIFHKKTPGKLSISFYKNRDSLLCTIEDDGVGRKKSTEIKNRSPKNHISRGMEIINDRLEVIKKTDDFDIDYKITDLSDIKGNALGTRVSIKIPFVD